MQGCKLPLSYLTCRVRRILYERMRAPCTFAAPGGRLLSACLQPIDLHPWLRYWLHFVHAQGDADRDLHPQPIVQNEGCAAGRAAARRAVLDLGAGLHLAQPLPKGHCRHQRRLLRETSLSCPTCNLYGSTYCHAMQTVQADRQSHAKLARLQGGVRMCTWRADDSRSSLLLQPSKGM